MVFFSRLPTADNNKTFAQRRAERIQQGARDPIFDAHFEDRRKIRRAAEQGRIAGAQQAAAAEQKRKQAELESIPEHERRPRNQWLDLIELRQKDAWRKDVARRIKGYAVEAKREEKRIDSLMAEKARRHQLENSPEYSRALDHWQRASQGAESVEEQAAFAKLKGLIESGGAANYWAECQQLLEDRLRRIQAKMSDHSGRQAPLDLEAKNLAAEELAAEKLLIDPEQIEEE